MIISETFYYSTCFKRFWFEVVIEVIKFSKFSTTNHFQVWKAKKRAACRATCTWMSPMHPVWGSGTDTAVLHNAVRSSTEDFNAVIQICCQSHCIALHLSKLHSFLQGSIQVWVAADIPENPHVFIKSIWFPKSLNMTSLCILLAFLSVAFCTGRAEDLPSL